MADRPDPTHPALAAEGASALLEPHAGLRYVARLFKMLALLLVLLLVSEAALGFVQQGRGAIPVVLVEATRLLVFAGVLWGAGDIALMLIESNHDLRATRVLLWQLTALMQRRMEEEGIAVEPIRPPEPPHDRR